MFPAFIDIETIDAVTAQTARDRNSFEMTVQRQNAKDNLFITCSFADHSYVRS
jgi:hypothetical protein